MQTARIDPTFASWRDAARRLLAAGIAPDQVTWQADPAARDLFDAGQERAAAGTSLRISRELAQWLEAAAAYRAPERWAVLYRIVWRWAHGERDAVSPADRDGARLHAMVKAVQRDAHKMKAFLRFRERPATAGPPQFHAWFEPEHDVLRWVADEIADRMGRHTWLIGTPRGTARFDGQSLHLDPTPAARDAFATDDRVEALWLVYYESIFNPARVNPDVMRAQLPVRYWKNLPEGVLIPRLVSTAHSGTRRTAQTENVGVRAGKEGKTIMIAAQDAQPERAEPSSLNACRRCDLWEHATQAVPGEGAPAARIMVVGEQPGDQEDLAGHAFVGPAGQVLDAAFATADLPRQSVYLTNAVKHFKWELRGKRRLHKTPGQREIEACAYWLDGEIASVAPKVIVTLGATALKAVLGVKTASVAGHLGQPFQHAGRWIVATYHPSYALRTPDEKARQAVIAQIAESLAQAQQLAGSAA